MPAEEIIALINKKLDDIDRDRQEVRALVRDLSRAGAESWDWISVKKASEMLGVSVGLIYSRINGGKLKARHIGAKTFVSASEVMAIDDR